MYSGNSEGKDIQNVKEAQKYMGNETKRLEEQRKLHLVTTPRPRNSRVKRLVHDRQALKYMPKMMAPGSIKSL